MILFLVQVSPDNDVYGSYGVEPGMKRWVSQQYAITWSMFIH